MELLIVVGLVAAGWWYLVREEQRKKQKREQPKPSAVTSFAPVTSTAYEPRIPEPTVPPGRKASVPAYVADDGDDDFGDGPPVSLPLSLWIEYRDATGSVSARRISVRNLRYSKKRIAVNAFCHEREAPRCFISERITMAADLETGEVLQPNPAAWLLNAYTSHPDGRRYFDRQDMDAAAAAHRQRFQDALLVLVYVARADGRMTAVERRVILGAAATIRAADPAFGALPELTDTQLQRMRCDHSEFLRAVRVLKSSADWLKLAVTQAAQAVMDADGKQDAEEAKALAWLRRSLG